MFIAFSFSNFRSYKTIETLSMVAADIVSNPKILDENNTFWATPKLRLLHSKAIYGANASGKSNIVKALFAFISLVRRSVKDEGLLASLIKHFALNTENENKPSFFQLVFIDNNTPYRYGFEIQGNKVVSEWLFGTPNGREVAYFMRENEAVSVKRWFKGAKHFETVGRKDNEVFRANSLFLSSVATMGNRFAKDIVLAITNINVILGINDPQLQRLLQEEINDLGKKAKIVEFVRSADIDIADIFVKPANLEHFPEHIRDLVDSGQAEVMGDMVSVRKQYDNAGQYVHMIERDSDEWESEGTKKIMALSPILISVLTEGKTLVVDEFDARLHPHLTNVIVSLFHSPETNPNHAQLIFVTHDTSLLKPNKLRRDQICFVKKDRYGCSSLTTLVEYKGVRNDAAYDKNYLEGAYEAVPFLNEISTFFTQNEPENK